MTNSYKCYRHMVGMLFVQVALMAASPGISFALDKPTQDLLDRRVSVRAAQQPVGDVLSSLKKQVSTSFAYSPQVLPPKRPVSLTVTNEPLSSALNQLLTPLGVGYRVAGKQIVLSRLAGRADVPAPVTANPVGTSLEATPAVDNDKQDRPITGVVTDENGQPLPGVTVLLKSTGRGTTTTINGSYSLSVPENGGSLIFSFVGYVAQEVAVGSRTQVSVQLITDVKALGEVVVVGFGTKERANLTESIVSVKGSDLVKTPVSGVDQALQGRAAGVNVVSNSAQPGGAVSIQVRGLGTINNAEPLFVIDGVVYRDPGGGGLSNLNPNDIESIDILKDASATAIYGFQASNGVVVITTKRGRAGKPKVTLNAYTGTQTPWKMLNPLSAAQYAAYDNEWIDRYNAPLPEDSRIKKNPDWVNPESLGAGTNWMKQVFRSAPMTDINLGLNGGTGGLNYNLSLGYRNQQGIGVQSGFKRYTLSNSIDYEANKRLKFGIYFSYSNSTRQELYANALSSSSAVFNAFTYSPTLPVYGPDGNYFQPPAETSTPDASAWFRLSPWNPLALARARDNFNYSTNLFASLYSQYTILPGLNFRSSFGLFQWRSFSENWTSRILNPSTGYGSTNLLSVGNSEGFGYNWDNYFTYDRAFGAHKMTLTAGSQTIYNSSQGFGVGQSDFLSDNVGTRLIGNGRSTIGSQYNSANDESAVGFYLRLNYNFNDRYLVTLTGRRDGTSIFLNNKWGNFGSASAAWRISNEAFMKNVTAISDLKIRVGFGINGNKNAGSYYTGYNQLATIGGNYPLNNQSTLGVVPASAGNPNLTWERGEQTDLGLDVGLLKNKVSLTLDLYRRRTRGLLLSRQQEAIRGTETNRDGYTPNNNAPTVNQGTVLNEGLEFVLGYRDTKGKVTYSLSANGGFNRNKLEDLGTEQFIPFTSRLGLGDINRYVVGQPLGSFFGFRTDGIFQTVDEIAAAPKQESSTAPGDIRYRDLNNDKVINQNDREIIGNPNPRFIYGLTGNVAYGSFDINFLLQGVQGVEIYNGFANQINAEGGGSTSPISKTVEWYNQRWTGPGTSNRIPRLIRGNPNLNARPSDLFIEDGSYLRARSIQLGYTLPAALITKLRMEKIRVYVTAQNLFTITKYTGFDPEILKNPNGDGGNDVRKNYDVGIDLGVYPQPRSYLVGVSIGF